MEISEVKVKLMGERSDRLKAFCSITIDSEFVIRDLKVIHGTNGMFVAMPSRKITDRCPTCGAKNHLRAKFCNECGGRLSESRVGRDAQGRAKLHADIAHPINSGCRDRMQRSIIKSYEKERERAKIPGYKPVEDEDFDDSEYMEHEIVDGPATSSAPSGVPEQLDAGGGSAEAEREKEGESDGFGKGIF